MSEVHVFGIRHHGPGSARSLILALDALQPDILLIEGPPDADGIIPLAGYKTMIPPVALLVYVPDKPTKAAFYPFAVFSPEWQAMQYALSAQIPVRFMDLPLSYRFAIEPETSEDQAAESELPKTPTSEESSAEPTIRQDPLGALARAAGYPDGERWWEQMVEHRRDSRELFAAVLEAMSALRESVTDEVIPDQQFVYQENLREAYMRKTIRAAQKEGYHRIAVVCGAWHAPVLAHMPPQKEDQELLKGLKKVKIEATWLPWTHGRLSYYSGYGAGIRSPGWYQFLWDTPTEQITNGWLTKVAHYLREQDLDASPAQVIDAARLSETLAALRGRAIPTLDEFNEATLSVLCFGNDTPMRLLHQKLIIGETMGEIPDETPMVPLQRDLIHQQRHLRMRPEVNESKLTLDLRETMHLHKSHLLHRLAILGVSWGQKEPVKQKGTFKEVWRLRWSPENTIQLIEKSPYGNTIYEAASAYALHVAKGEPELAVLTALVNEVLQAELPEAVDELVHRLQVIAALTGDVSKLMAALPALVDVLLYGNVRKTDRTMVSEVVDGIVTRACIGLPTAVHALGDDTARELFLLIRNFNVALRMLQHAEHLETWHNVLARIMGQTTVHGLIRGRACRILLDSAVINGEIAAQHMRFTLNGIEDASQAAAWLQGFLAGSGLILLHDENLLKILDGWVATLRPEEFIALLPMVRKTFSTFTQPERQQIGVKVKGILSEIPTEKKNRPDSVDQDRADSILGILGHLLGNDPLPE
jgi:hypothetical protein